MTQLEIKKTPIEKLGKEKVTIADEREHRSSYYVVPPMAIKDLVSAWLDPSDLDAGYLKQCVMYFGGKKELISNSTMELLPTLIDPKYLRNGTIRFEVEQYWHFSKVKHRILRRYNLVDLVINSKANLVREFEICSNQPYYDMDAHANRVYRMMKAVHRKFDGVLLPRKGCLDSGACSPRVEQAVRKALEEAQKEARKL